MPELAIPPISCRKLGKCNTAAEEKLQQLGKRIGEKANVIISKGQGDFIMEYGQINDFSNVVDG